MTLSAASLTAIEADSEWRQHRVAKVNTPDGVLLVKGQRPGRGPGRFKLMTWLSRWTRNPLLQPVPAYGGVRAQSIEVKRLAQLAAAGLPVPAVLHQGSDFIALQFLQGQSLQHHLTLAPEEALAMFEQGLQAIHQVHQKGQYLSQAFARNIMVVQGSLWFIDFEDDPLEVLSLQDAQTRDWLAYLLSTVWMANAPMAQLLAVWQHIYGQLDSATQAAIVQACSRLRWLRRLPRERKPWGRDIVTLNALGEFLHAWQSNLHHVKGAVKHA
jgi:tRNA A-37 threonylcarbamoyl transferase component Bud32